MKRSEADHPDLRPKAKEGRIHSVQPNFAANALERIGVALARQ